MHQIGWGRRGVKQTQLQGNTWEATTFTVAFSMGSGLQIVHADRTDAVLPEHPGRSALTTSRPRTVGHHDDAPAARVHSGQRAEPEQGRTKRGSFSGTMASIHASADTLAAMRATFIHVVLCFIPPHITSCLQPCDVAIFRSFRSSTQAQASTTLCPSSHRRLVRTLGHEQDMAAPVFGRLGGSRTHGPL